MVQRKVPTKLGIQADHLHVKSEKRLGNLGPSSPRDSDLKKSKKKMKKSRSIKRSDFGSLRSPNSRREVPAQPGKPPPPPHPPLLDASRATPPQKQLPDMRRSEASPNYMKSTSSSDARKDRSQVSSSSSSQPCIDRKSPKRTSNNSKLGSGSGHKLASKTLTRTSSLKLTKTPSFKPARSSPSSSATKKCTQVVLCENLDAQRATCSSTLKESKFPTYLELSPGATESEGTSAMKVCPYTYCSLNGHRHGPLPPLKCFLSARRRVMKTQKSMKKLGCLSPRHRPKPDGRKEVDVNQKPAIQVTDLNPLIHDDQMGFLVEIYVRDLKYADEIGFAAKDFMPPVEERIEKALDDRIGEAISPEVEISESYSEDKQNMEAAEEEETLEWLSYHRGFEAKTNVKSELDETDSETSDMEWAEGQYSAPSLDEESGNLAHGDSCFKDEEPIFKADGIFSIFFDEISADEGADEFFDEEGARPGAGFSNGGSSDSETEGSFQGSDEPIQVFNNQSHQATSSYDDFQESNMEEIDGNFLSNEFVGAALSLAFIEEPIEETKEDPIPGIKVEALIKCQMEDESLVECEASALLGYQESNSSCDFAESQDDPAYGDHFSSDKTEDEQFEAVGEEAHDRSFLSEDSETNQSLEQELPAPDDNDVFKKEQEDHPAKSLIEIPTSDSLQDFSEAESNMTKEIDSEIQLGAANRDGLSVETEVHSFDQKQSQSDNVHESQNQSEKEGFSKTRDPSDSEDVIHSGRLNSVSEAQNNETTDEMEVEFSTISEPEGGFSSGKIAASKQSRTVFSRGEKNSIQEDPKATINLNIIRSKGLAEGLDNPRTFNPREPNYLPVQPDPEAEKVDLRHQMVDERKNAEEWMVDYALRQAVNKLAPSRKRKVALLVEAFENVKSIPKYERHLRHTSPAFAHARPIQACS